MQRSKKVKAIPREFKSLEEAAEFWDTHDLSDYWEDTKEVVADLKVPKIPRYVPLEGEIAEVISKISKQRHISFETLVNLWLKEKLLKPAQNA